jgi:hypothetical protein
MREHSHAAADDLLGERIESKWIVEHTKTSARHTPARNFRKKES